MPRRQPRSAISAAERSLIEAYARAWQRVVDFQEAIADDPAQWRRARKLSEARRAIEAELDALDARALAWFSNEFPRVYAMGVNAGAAELSAPAAAVWNLIDTRAVTVMANEGFGDLLRATRRMRRTTKALIREVLGDAALGRLIEGDTAKAAGRRAARILDRHGIHAVVYKDGSRHGIKEYAQVVVRTKTAVAYNTGVLDAQASQGVKYWEVFDGLCGWTFHDSPDMANGKIVTRDEALAYPISHPNCRRAFGARPDLGEGPKPEPPDPKTLMPTAEARERARKRTEARLRRRKVPGGR